MELIKNNLAVNTNFLVQLDTRVKIISVLLIIVIATSLKTINTLAIAVSLMLCLLIYTRVPFRECLTRILWVLPFAGVMLILMPFVTPGQEAAVFSLGAWKVAVTQQGIAKAFMYTGRVLTSVLALSYLTLTTDLSELLHGLRKVGLPAILVNLLAFTIRYFSVFQEELERMKVARKARGFQAGKSLLDVHTMRTLAELIGILFIRSYERGDRVYNSMLARGYTGEFSCCGHCLPSLKECCAGIVLVILVLGLKAIELGGFI
ncbi:cobalt ECF transporter T component CbiQ [Bacillota bacterium LX-D]|nr:cobalt ECF transporter T component CbiQ [Bacillota bacterium LX-D]